ncbi:MAG: efflux RND transporter periplasmic adaptor subunit [bacterium]
MKFSSKQQKIIIATIIILIFVMAGFYRINKQSTQQVVMTMPVTQQVSTMKLAANTKNGILNAEGTVKAASKIDIIAMTNGSVKNINFKVGDKVETNQPLVSLQDSTLSTNYANSSLNYSNISQNRENINALTNEMLQQSELGIARAKELLNAAQISFDNAQLNINNVKDLQSKNKEDMRNNAIVSIANYNNTINSALDQINTIYGINGYQLDGLSDTLSVKNSQLLISGKISYQSARDLYTQSSQHNYSAAQAEIALSETINTLTKTKKANDDVISVLAASISSTKFPESSLNLQKTSFNQLRSTLIGSITAAQTNLQALQNINLSNKRELDGLNTSLKAAQNQVYQAELGVTNAVSVLNNSKQSKEQQLLMSKTSLDGAQGQLKLIATQLSDLTVKAPISGQISARTIEIGTEVRAGQKLGEIAQINTVKIMVQLTPEDASLIKIGSTAVISDNLKGVINNISPTADALTKKVQIEIIIDNKDKKLKPETLVTVTLPISSDKIDTHEFLVPLSAITVTQNETYIFIVNGHQAKKINVELINVDGEQATIRVKLSGKDLLIIDGNKTLKDGDQISI